jgi:hypothetical protein
MEEGKGLQVLRGVIRFKGGGVTCELNGEQGAAFVNCLGKA